MYSQQGLAQGELSFHYCSENKTQKPKSNPTQPQNNPPHLFPVPSSIWGALQVFYMGQSEEGCSYLRSWTADVMCCAVHQLIVQGSGNLPAHPPLLPSLLLLGVGL